MTETIKRLRFPRLRFPVPVVTTLALLVILAAVALSGTAQAQTAITLVSNIGQTDSTILNPVGQRQAIQFTTGDNAAGYNLDSVEMSVGDYENVVVTVSLYSDSSGEPGSSIFNFTNPTSGITADAVNTFTAPADTTLAGSNTPYFIVVYGTNDPDESTNKLGINTTSANAEDSGGATNAAGDADWEIADRRHWQFGSSWNTSAVELKIRLKGSAKSGGDTPACTLNEGDIWCGVMDVGTITNSGGATQSHGFQGTTGDLSDKTFSLMFETGTTNNYTIVAIVVGATTANSEQLYFVTSSSLTDTEEESLALHVDGESDPFVWSDSTELIAGSYRWPARTDLDWSSETTVTLRLREFPRPTVTNVAVTSMPVLETDTYGAGETIEVSVTFSEAVDATSDTDFELNVSDDKSAPLVDGSGTETLVFGYTVAPDEEDDNGIWIGDQDRTLVGSRVVSAQSGTITSVATSATADLTHDALRTQPGHKVDGTRSIVSVEVTSEPLLETDTYGAGETIQFTVTFTAAVDVDGDPVLEFLFDGSELRQAGDVSGSGTTELVFGYTVVSGDDDDNGLFIRDESDYNNPDGPVRLDSNDEIEFKDTSTDAPLYWSGRGTQSGHKVDGSRMTGNNPPSFTSLATFDAAENQTAAGTVVAADSDSDDSVTGYAITGGADQDFFSIGATSGALTFDAAPNYEDAKDQSSNNTYVVDVTATSGTGTRVKTATQTITVTVTDVDTEAPGKPAKPRVSAASVTSLRVNWSAPSNAGPAITDYDVQYRAGTSGAWSTKSHSGTATATTLTGLTEDTPYQVQVRAKNAEGTGAWSDSGSGTPAEEDNLPADTTTTGEVEVGGAAVRGDILAPVEETVTWTIINTEGEEEEKTGTVYDFDTDWFAVELEKDKTYRIDMKGHTPENGLSLRLPQINAIYNSDGEFLVNTWSRDESDSHYLFRVTYHARASSTYYIAASGESHEWGTYELRVKDITEDDDEHTAAQRGLKNLRAVEEKGGVRLTWQPPDGAAVTGYRIERRRAGGQDSGPQRSHGQPRDHHTLVEDTGNTETSYVDESAKQGVEYEYRVTARNESGPGEESDWVRAGPASASNNPATGAPTISGTTQVGETLTADISGIADADGLSGETFTYQWVSSDGTTDTDIENATGSTYTLIAADQGKSVKVSVTFTDDGGNEETLTSAPTGPVLGDGLPGAPRNLTATPGNREVSLSWDPPDDNGNAPATRYRIEWRVDGQDYGTSQWGTSRETTYTTNDQANLANGVKYFFRVKAENGSGNSYGPYGPASEEVSATPTSGSAVDLDTPVLSDTETLHHGMVQLDWQDIEDAGWYVVQYYHLEDEEWLDLPAEGVDIAFHGSSAVVSNLHGGLHWLRVGAASCAGSSEWSQIEELYGTNASDWEGVPVPEVEEGDETEPCPVVLGTPVLSDTEILHHGMVQLDWQDIEDAGWYVVQYYHLEDEEWLDLPAEGVDIAFHGSSAVVSNLHGLSWLRVGAASCDGASEWSQIEESYGTNASDWKGVPVPEVAEGDEIEPCSEDADTPDNSPATGAPTISGTAQVGETLTANTSGVADGDGLSNVQYEYQWLADDAEIAGATSLTYALSAADEGKAIKVEVSFTDDAGNEETLTSVATDAVAAAPTPNSPATGAPTISGTAQVGETLTANTSEVADADGLGNVQYEYQWLADDAEIAGATSLTYTLVVHQACIDG